MNTVNWSSGIDGQLAGVVGIGFLALGLVSLRSIESDPAQLLTAAIAFTAAGSYLGFLPWSFYPQKIMPGYGGSALAGFLLATLSILSGAKLATAALVLAVPLVDGVWTVARRLYQGKSPVWGDRKHLHHQLLKRGWGVPKIVLFYYSITALLALIALSLDSQGKLFAITMVVVILLGVLFTINLLSGRVRGEDT
jgi:UDP-GlcNAc:undecaprenyl-phosphate/decaprenyl-phosphate GlcNAc-1-phosphate transferase